MEPKYQPLITGFQRTYGAPAFKYQEISTISALSTEIPRTVRYPGQVVYIKDRKLMYYFKGATDDQSLVPISGELMVVQNKAEWMSLEDREKHDGQIVYCKDENEFFVAVHNSDGSWTLKYIDQHNIEFIQSKTESTFQNIRNPHIGQIVFIIDEQRYYRFVNGADSISDLKPLQVNYITSVDVLDTECPEILRYVGMCLWVKNEQRYYAFLSGISSSDFKPFNDEVIIIQSKTDISTYKNLREGQLVFVKGELELYSISNTGDLTYFNKHEIIEIDSRNATGFQQIKNPHVGQIVYVRNEKRYYHLAVSAVGYSDLIPLFFRSIETIDSVDNELPKDIREIGQMVFVKSLKNFYYFEGGTNKENLKPFGNSIVFIEDIASFSGITDSIVGQLYYCKKDKQYYIVVEADGKKVLKLFKDYNVFTVEKLADTQFSDILNPHIGQIIYDKTTKTYYRFESSAIAISDLKPLCWQNVSDINEIVNKINGQIFVIGTKSYIISSGNPKRILTQKFEKVISLMQNPDLVDTNVVISHKLNTRNIVFKTEVVFNGNTYNVFIPYKIQDENTVSFDYAGIYFGANQVGEIKVTVLGYDTD